MNCIARSKQDGKRLCHKKLGREMGIENYLIPYILSNVISIGLIFVYLKWLKIGRFIWVIIFLYAGIFNMKTAFRSPHAYMEMYGETAVFPFYKNFIYVLFNKHTTLFVSIIASGQILIALFLLLKSPWLQLGVLGSIIFLTAITPLGVGSAFPATLFMIARLIVLYRRITIKFSNNTTATK
jgi:hypothetical protein